jgi:uncharacterized protein YdaU (DUF1376 family)
MTIEWYPWYPALFRADTMHLSAEQDGIYRRLIDHYMETRQPLPDNDSALSRIAGVNSDAWAIAAAIVRPFFKPTKDGKLHHRRCDAELDRQDGRNRSQSEKGKKGAEARWNKSTTLQSINSHGHDLAIALPMPGDGILEEIREEIREERKEVTPYGVTKKGSRFALTDLPDDWKIFCTSKRPELDALELFAEFRDYWVGIPGAKGCKLDWFATWRNRVRDKRKPPHGVVSGQRPSTAAERDRNARVGAGTL